MKNGPRQGTFPYIRIHDLAYPRVSPETRVSYTRDITDLDCVLIPILLVDDCVELFIPDI